MDHNQISGCGDLELNMVFYQEHIEIISDRIFYRWICPECKKVLNNYSIPDIEKCPECRFKNNIEEQIPEETPGEIK